MLKILKKTYFLTVDYKTDFFNIFIKKPILFDFFVEKLFKKSLELFLIKQTGITKITIIYNKYLIFYKTGL